MTYSIIPSCYLNNDKKTSQTKSYISNPCGTSVLGVFSVSPIPCCAPSLTHGCQVGCGFCEAHATYDQPATSNFGNGKELRELDLKSTQDGKINNFLQTKMKRL